MDHLSMVAKAAREAGMSYGKYVALQYERNGYKTMPRGEEPVAEDEIRRCAVCGTPLEPGAHGLRKTCGRICSDELNRRRNAGYYTKKEKPETAVGAKPIPEFPFPDRKTNCQNCGKEFSLIGIHGGRKYCSDECCRDYANRAARERYAKRRAEKRRAENVESH